MEVIQNENEEFVFPNGTKAIPTNLADCYIIEPRVFGDEREYYSPVYQEDYMSAFGFERVIQDSKSLSKRGVLRGMHFQKYPFDQAKIVYVESGAVVDVVVDIRQDSPTFLQYTFVLLTPYDSKIPESGRQLFVPRGFAHGFLCLEDNTKFKYYIDNYYCPSMEAGITLGIIIGTSTIVGAATIFRSEDITYSNSATTKTNVKDSLDELYNLTSNYEFYKPLADQVELGDYISMTPTSINYAISSVITGADNNQTINPSKLNLWRVIRKNNDGTIDAVSEYVSSEKVSFKGKTGYSNIIGVLNHIAAQYTNDKYVQNTRHFGYYKTDEFCVNLNCNGPQASYSLDLNDLSRIKANKGVTVEKELSTYWTSYISGDLVDGGIRKSVYWVIPEGTGLEGTHLCSDFDNGEGTGTSGIRPILTFKATNIIKSGNGKSVDTAYIFN